MILLEVILFLFSVSTIEALAPWCSYADVDGNIALDLSSYAYTYSDQFRFDLSSFILYFYQVPSSVMRMKNESDVNSGTKNYAVKDPYSRDIYYWQPCG